jgi:hypothetical protein
MNLLMNDFVTKSLLIRRELQNHRSWIEARLGVSLCDTVILQVGLDFAQIGIEKILGLSDPQQSTSRLIKRLSPLVRSAEIPPDVGPPGSTVD